jgi:hypothetical protein
LCLGHRHRRLPGKSKESALCASFTGHLHLSLHEPISRVLDRSEVFHQTCHRYHHGARQIPPACARNTTCILHRASAAPRRQDPSSLMCEGKRRSTSEPPLASDCIQNDAPQGKNYTRRRHRPIWVTPGAAPSPADIFSKNDALKRGKQRRTPPSSDPRVPDLGFPSEQPESSDENNRDNAFMKVATSRDAVIVRPDRSRDSIFTGCLITRTRHRLEHHCRPTNSGGEGGHHHQAWDRRPRQPHAAGLAQGHPDADQGREEADHHVQVKARPGPSGPRSGPPTPPTPPSHASTS